MALLLFLKLFILICSFEIIPLLLRLHTYAYACMEEYVRICKLWVYLCVYSDRKTQMHAHLSQEECQYFKTTLLTSNFVNACAECIKCKCCEYFSSKQKYFLRGILDYIKLSILESQHYNVILFVFKIRYMEKAGIL